MSTAHFTVGQRLQRTLLVGLSRLPASIQRTLATPPTNTSGDRMAPDVALLMKLVEAGEDFSDMSATYARDITERDLALFSDQIDPCTIEQDIELPAGLQATRYSSGQTPTGLILFFHGGGFVLGSRASYAAPARMLAHGTGADVLSVEYGLAPEHHFPQPHTDALAAWRYVADHAAEWGVDPRRVVVAGESAGGNIAAVLCQQLRGEALQPLLQVLLQPVTDLSEHRPSMSEFAGSPALSAKQIAWFTDHYLPAGTDRRDPRVSPLLGDDLSNLPRAIVSLAGFDPLHDDGLAYATALLEAGVPVEVLEEPSLVHGFISYIAVSPSCKQATNRLVDALAAALKDTTATTTHPIRKAR